MAGCHFVEGYEDFPVCNHVLEVDSENIGYQTGMFDDGLPFEVEEYEYDENDNRDSEWREDKYEYSLLSQVSDHISILCSM